MFVLVRMTARHTIHPFLVMLHPAEDKKAAGVSYKNAFPCLTAAIVDWSVCAADPPAQLPPARHGRRGSLLRVQEEDGGHVLHRTLLPFSRRLDRDRTQIFMWMSFRGFEPLKASCGSVLCLSLLLYLTVL